MGVAPPLPSRLGRFSCSRRYTLGIHTHVPSRLNSDSKSMEKSSSFRLSSFPLFSLVYIYSCSRLIQVLSPRYLVHSRLVISSKLRLPPSCCCFYGSPLHHCYVREQ